MVSSFPKERRYLAWLFVSSSGAWAMPVWRMNEAKALSPNLVSRALIVSLVRLISSDEPVMIEKLPAIAEKATTLPPCDSRNRRKA